VDFADANHGWVLGGDSAVYRTDDGGRTWESEPIRAATYRLYDLSAVGPDEAYIAAALATTPRAAVLEYRPDIHEWGRIIEEPPGTLRCLIARSTNYIWAAGETVERDYLAERRRDADTWLPMTIPSRVSALSFPSNRRGWAACTSGRIFATADHGESWDEQPTPVLCDLNDIHFCSRAKGMALSSDGELVLVTSEGGTSWEVQRAPEDAQALLFDGGNYLLLTRTALFRHAEITGRLIPSVRALEPRTGSGPREIAPMPGPYVRPWRRCRSFDEARGDSTLKAACFLDDNRHAWVLGQRGGHSHLFRTTSGGVSWEVLALPISAIRRSQGVAFADSRNGWLYGPHECIWRTEDGGSTWVAENVDGGWSVGDEVLALETLDAENAVAAVRFHGRDRSDLLQRAPETGVWTITEHSLPNPPEPKLAALGSTDPRAWLVWVMSSSWHGLRTQRWFPEMERMTLGTDRNHIVRSVFFLTPIDGWVCAGEYVFVTEDGGRTWRSWIVAYPDPANYFLDVVFENRVHGYAVTRLGQVMTTEDGGETWRKCYEAESPNLISVHWFGWPSESWWALAEDGLYTNTPEPERPTLGTAEPLRPALAQALLSWSEHSWWNRDGVCPEDGQVGREAVFRVRWDRRNSGPPGELQLLIQPPGAAFPSPVALRPLDYWDAQEHGGAGDWGVGYTPAVAGTYHYRFRGRNEEGRETTGEPTEWMTWPVE